MVDAITVVGAIAAVIVALSVAAYVVTVYNRLVRVRRQAETRWADVDVLLTQRGDLLEKLVDAVEQSMAHEQAVLRELTAARDQERQARTPREEAATGEMVREAVHHLSVRAEANPDLQSAENVEQLQEEISRIESAIADRREVYNEAATAQNTLVQQFPYVVFARLLGFEQRELYDPPESETADVDVSEIGAETAAADADQQ